MDLQSLVRTIPDYPKKGIMFRDITTLLKDTTGFNIAITRLKERYCNYQIDKVVGIESRGFIVGAALAHALGKGFVPVRKVGKLPGNKITQTYQLEYGTDTIEMHTDSLQPKERVLLVDDLLATGGTVLGAIQRLLFGQPQSWSL